MAHDSATNDSSSDNNNERSSCPSDDEELMDAIVKHQGGNEARECRDNRDSDALKRLLAYDGRICRQEREMFERLEKGLIKDEGWVSHI